MKEYELHIRGHWYARVDAVFCQTFDDKDLLDSGLEPEAYAKRLFDNAHYPNVTWHDFNQDIVHEQEQIMGDLEIDPVWVLKTCSEKDSSGDESND